MALTAVLVETTPQRLLYLISQSGQSIQGTTLVIPNVNDATPDLGTDSLDDTPMGDACDYSRDHALVMTVAQARALLLGDNAMGASAGLGGGTGPDNGVTGDFNAPRCHCHITARGGADGWGVDASIHAVTGEPELTIFGPAGNGAEAYLEIVYSYSAAT